MKEEMNNINTGIDTTSRELIKGKLSTILASNYTLTLKTQNFHWNVKGMLFQQLHGLFEEQYNVLSTANDDIAERIRALGFLAPGSYSKFIKLSFIKESDEDISAEKMIEILLGDYEILIKEIRETIAIAGEKSDESTNDVLTPLLSGYEKTAWMLRSFLG